MELVNVYIAAGQLEAEMIKSFLEAQGIDVILNQESVGRTYGLSAGPLGMVKVFVPQNQVDEAESVLKAMSEGEFENNLTEDEGQIKSPDILDSD